MSDAPHATPEERAGDHSEPDRPGDPRREDRLKTVGEITHELNNVLGGILMAAAYGASQVNLGTRADTSEKLLAGIKADAERCIEIVRRLQRLAGDHGEVG
jgi:signal transduction histidine kinase